MTGLLVVTTLALGIGVGFEVGRLAHNQVMEDLQEKIDRLERKVERL